MTVTKLPEVSVFFVKSLNGIEGVQQAFGTLESKFPDMKRRKFYGAIYGAQPDEEYYACVAVHPGDDPKEMGLETMVLPGGRYMQKKIFDWNRSVHRIGEVFQELSQAETMDTTRPRIEFYRSMNEMYCQMPIG